MLAQLDGTLIVAESGVVRPRASSLSTASSATMPPSLLVLLPCTLLLVDNNLLHLACPADRACRQPVATAVYA